MHVFVSTCITTNGLLLISISLSSRVKESAVSRILERHVLGSVNPDTKGHENMYIYISLMTSLASIEQSKSHLPAVGTCHEIYIKGNRSMTRNIYIYVCFLMSE